MFFSRLYNKNQVFSFGCNFEGELGQDDKIPRSIPTKVKMFFTPQSPAISPTKQVDENEISRLSSVDNPKIVKISSKGYHNAILLDDGSVMMNGYSGNGNCGHGSETSLTRPTILKCFKNRKIKNVSLGGEHSFFVSENNEIFSTGRNKYGQLGVGDNISRLAPVVVDIKCDKDIVDIVCGYEYTLFLSKSGEFLACGRNSDGNLGLGDRISRNVPTKSNFEKKVVKIYAGYFHSFVITEDTSIYGYWWNNEGQMGVGHKKDLLVPTLIESLKGKKLTEIALGRSHSLFLTNENEVFCCGNSECGQLGLGVFKSKNDNVLVPTKIKFRKKIIAIACGYYHSLFCTNSGYYACGSDEFGQLGTGKKVNQCILSKIKVQNVPEINLQSFVDKNQSKNDVKEEETEDSKEKMEEKIFFEEIVDESNLKVNEEKTMMELMKELIISFKREQMEAKKERKMILEKLNVMKKENEKLKLFRKKMFKLMVNEFEDNV